MTSSNQNPETDLTFDEQTIEARLADELPRWHYASGMICRRFDTANWKGTLMVINAVGHLCEVAWHHPDISAAYNFVEIRLMNHAARGITEKDFELAKKIEEFVYWQPQQETGALEGTPQDDRFRYIRYD